MQITVKPLYCGIAQINNFNFQNKDELSGESNFSCHKPQSIVGGGDTDEVRFGKVQPKVLNGRCLLGLLIARL